MSAGKTKAYFQMAAPAAILILLPGMAMAEVCDKGDAAINFLDYVPALNQWVLSNPDGVQIKQFFTPGAWITGAILIWLLVTNTARPTIIAGCWFLFLAAIAALSYFASDPSDPAYQAMIREGCAEHTPRHILSNLGFAVIAGLLTWQRIRRQKSEAPR